MGRNRFISVFIAGYVFVRAAAIVSPAFADDTYTPPSSPDLYEKEPVEGPAAKIRSKLYAGFNLGIGQSQSAGQRGAKAAFLLSPKMGYNKVLSSWSLFDADVSLLAGELGYSRADVRVNYGMMMRVGYGYSLGSHAYGIWKVGVGLYNAEYTWTANDYKAKGRTGTLLQGAFELLFPISSTLAITGSAQWNQFVLGIADVKGNGQSLDLDRTERFNVWLADVGIRFYL